jgi:hypothetical protein
MTRHRLEVADVFQSHGPAFLDQFDDVLSPQQRRVLHDISICRTAELGGHVEECDHCGHQRIAYNSCRNRHCPKCQATASAQWMKARTAELLPVEYFHVVFTLPTTLGPIGPVLPATCPNCGFEDISPCPICRQRSPRATRRRRPAKRSHHSQLLHAHPSVESLVPSSDR